METVTDLVIADAAADATRIENRRRDLARHRGVAWSGLAPDPATPRSGTELRAAAEARLAARRAWAASSDGRLLSTIAACQAAAQQIHALGERVRAGVSRDEPRDWRRGLLADLASSAHALNSSLTEALAAIDGEDGAT